MKLTNLTSPAGNVVPNQFQVETEEGIFFQSYESVIAKIVNEVVTLDTKYWNYSKTTSKYRNMFLRETSEETKAKVKSGIYKLANLN